MMYGRLDTELEGRISGVGTLLECDSIPKTKKGLADEPTHLRLRLERAASIFHAANKLNSIQTIGAGSVWLAINKRG